MKAFRKHIRIGLLELAVLISPFLSTYAQSGLAEKSSTGSSKSFQRIRTHHKHTNREGIASFKNRGISFLVRDLVSQQPVAGMRVTLVEQEDGPSAITVIDPGGNRVPVVSSLSDLPLLRADPIYAVDTVLTSMTGLGPAFLPISIVDVSQEQYQASCVFVPGSEVLQQVESDIAPDAAVTVLMIGVDLGKALDYVGAVTAAFQAGNSLTALAYAQLISSSFQTQNNIYKVCHYSVGNPLVGVAAVTIQLVDTSSVTAFDLQGTVKDTLGNTLAGATVVAIGPDQRAAITDADGTFTLSSLQPGTYTLQAQKDGFGPYAASVIIDDSKNIQITLSPPTGIATGVCPNPLPGPTTTVFYTGTFSITGQNFKPGDFVTTDGPILLTGNSSVNSEGTVISQGYQIGCCGPQNGQTFHLFVNTPPSGIFSIVDTISLVSSQPPNLCASH